MRWCYDYDIVDAGRKGMLGMYLWVVYVYVCGWKEHV